jgi:1,4-dihydroxy-2-naphthoate octaprenyltransferase
MKLRALISAMRFRTLPLAIVGVSFGLFAVAIEGAVNWGIAGLIIMTAVLLQIFSNIANDYGDYKNGADGDERSDRGVASGKVTLSEMKSFMILMGTLSFLCGFVLLFVAFREYMVFFLSFLAIGLVSIWAAFKYTAGNKPYGYTGLGDLSVFVFFGLVSVIGSYFLQTKSLDNHLWLLAAGAGLFSVSVLNINNIRDIDSDSKSGKITLAVRLGKENAVLYQRLIYLGAIGLTTWYAMAFDLKYSLLSAFFVGPLFYILSMKVKKANEREKLNKYLKINVLLILIYSLVYWVGGAIQI